MVQSDGYGLVKKKPKRDRRQGKRSKEFAKNRNITNLEFIKGLRAYQKAGSKDVTGIIIIDRK